MALQQGMRLGAYEVISPLGAGGMGEVYRARDTKLQRDVALKILPEAMARDAQRMARFEREAQVLASLNHPNIAAIYGLEESNGVRALVMELVEGETLAERISVAAVSPPPGGFPKRKAAGEDTGATTGDRRSTMTPDDVLPIARQIAEALEYAHERGVIHRDLKPANVKITHEGTVKVLDFGLAKVLDAQDSTTTMDIANSPTLSAMATQAGMILGTAAYMSPEQAKGQRVDRRADIWAFGCVLYEMLTGRKPFEGGTISEVLASVIKSEPVWDAIPDTTPPSIQKLVRRCLVKNPKQRLRDIGEARIAIEETISGDADVAAGLPSHGAAGQTEIGDVKPPLRRALPWAVAVVAILVAAAIVWLRPSAPSPAPGWSGELLPGPTIAFGPRVSPDGRLIAFQAMINNLTQVAVMDPKSGNWTVLISDRTNGLLASLCWSQDGSRIYFSRAISQPVGVFSVPSLGGPDRLILANAASPESLPDGSLLLVRVDPDRRDQIYHYWPDTGRLQALGAWVDLAPSAPLRVFPGGKEAVFFGTIKGKESENSPHLYLLDIATGNARRLAPELQIVQSSQLFALAVTPDGKSVLIDLPSGDLHRIVAIPRSGDGPVRTLLTLTRAPWTIDVSTDGSLYIDQTDRPLQILKLPVSGGTPEVLASLEFYTYTYSLSAPVDLPDGRLLLPSIISGRSRLMLAKPGGSPVPLLETNEETTSPMTQVGGDEVAFVAGSSPAKSLAIASAKNGRILHRFKATEGKDIGTVAASPDGKVLYYASSGKIWAVPSQGGNPHEICSGDGVAVDPNGRDLIVDLIGQGRVRLERVPLAGGPAQPIQLKSDLLLSPVALGPRAINKKGELLVSVAPRDSWFFGLAIVDLSTGKMRRIPLNYAGDTFYPAWASDGSILVTSELMGGHVWRFRPIH
jgi:Tol biopolymer transport system component/tRNA A-37 threonylcarbamoyl transferase component Bud32